MQKRVLVLVLVMLGLPLGAYVGPGAGFAFVGSFLFVFVAFFLAAVNFLTFPVRALIRFLRRLGSRKKALFKRVIIVGFDGMDYRLLSKSIQAHPEQFPHFTKLAETGSFRPLWSTEPPISPVAWSTFSTGVNPGKHNIFDFLTTDRKTYMPKMAGSEIIVSKRNLTIGPWRIPLAKPKIELRRKSVSFWKQVGEKGILTTVLRVPFTFPPEKFKGQMLSGLGTPDLRGTQGSFTSFDTQNQAEGGYAVSDGISQPLQDLGKGRYRGILHGPEHPFAREKRNLVREFVLEPGRDPGQMDFVMDGQKTVISVGQISPWIMIEFKVGMLKIRGQIQLVLASDKPPKLYVSPINIDPEKPSMPISHPKIFSVYLAKAHGIFSTLGMAEDTSALNDGVISESVMLDQIESYQRERETIFFDAMSKNRSGLLVQVFESTDRVSHMFWRYFDPEQAKNQNIPARIRDAVLDNYRSMDAFLGRLMPKIGKNDLLMIVSDHGFDRASREFHLNSWLHEQGYLVLREGCEKSGKWYADVDWSRTVAYGQGLNGLFINQQGREEQGIVKAGAQMEKLKDEIKEKLLAQVDPKTGQKPLAGVYKREELYKGPYLVNAPDIVLGYQIGYKVAWLSAVNTVGEPVFSDNDKAWGGDHCFTSLQVPGIFFANEKVKETDPGLIHIAATVLKAFGIKPPSHMDGPALTFSREKVL
jgi:predicted AlkP superfamily phosphohydrolase/phosphomutase